MEAMAHRVGLPNVKNKGIFQHHPASVQQPEDHINEHTGSKQLKLVLAEGSHRSWQDVGVDRKLTQRIRTKEAKGVHNRSYSTTKCFE